MLYKSSLFFGSILFLGACTHPFQAASPNQAVPGSPRIARAATQGLTIEAQIDAWTGDPASLNTVLTPVRISLNNEGDHAVALRYKNFLLSNPEGVRSTAIPPFQIRGSTEEFGPVAISPMFTYRSFYPYSYYSFYGPGFGYWGDNWGWDAGWYNSAYGYWQRNLPTADMLRKAVPEGVLNPGGQVSGFLYFQLVPPNTKALDLQATLVDARTHDEFGVLDVPFVRK